MKAVVVLCAILCFTVAALAQPQINLSPNVLQLEATQNHTVTGLLQVHNSGNQTLTYHAYELQPAPASFTRILAWVKYVDYSREWPNTVAALNTFLGDFTLDTTTTENPTALASLLANKTAFLIPEQENAPSLVSLAQSWSTVLSEFAYSGGIIACISDGDDPTHQLIHDSGLLDITIINSIFNTTPAAILDLNHPFVVGLPDTFNVMNGWDNHSSMLGTCLVSASGHNNLTYRYYGQGMVAYWGVDFWEYNPNMAMLLCNMVRWNQSIPWLTVNPDTGSVAPSATGQIPVYVNPGYLMPSTRLGQVVVMSNDPVTPAILVPVYMTTEPETVPPTIVNIVPVNPPIQIPAGGGNFSFTIYVQNNQPTSLSFDAWIKLMLPTGSFIGPLLGPVRLTLPGLISVSRVRTQNIASTAVPGLYFYEAYTGIYPDTVWDSDGFTFTKLPMSETSSSNIDNWMNTGESLEYAVNDPDQNTDIQLKIHPNPFNASTVMSFDLPSASQVSFRIYDTLGRQIASLVEEQLQTGPHQVTFDGSTLATGVYIYRLQIDQELKSGKLLLVK